MSLQVSGQVQKGVLPSVASGTSSQPLTQGQFGEALVSELNARYGNLALTGSVFSISTAGAGQAQVAANLFSTAIATAQPIVGLYNPLTSNKNAVILKAYIGITAYPSAATLIGGFVYSVSAGQTITQAGTQGTNHLTFKQSGSTMVGLVNQALTGAVGSLIVLRPVPADNPPILQGTVAGDTPGFQIIEEQIEGSIIVPPGGVLGMFTGLTGTTSTFAAGLTWAELPL